MNRLIIIIIMITFSALFAEFKSASEAREIAENFLSYRNQNTAINNLMEIKENRAVKSYCFSLDPIGYIIVTSDDNLPPVLAYSFTSNCELSDESEMSFEQFIINDVNLRQEYYSLNEKHSLDNKKLWDNKYRVNETSQNSKNDVVRDFQQWPYPGCTPTDGWLETQWNQSGLLNDFCPLDNSGERSVVGCVATAMSQILHYHEYIGEVSFNQSDAYESGWGWDGIEIDGDHEEFDFPSFTELNAYLEALDDHYENNVDLTNDDLAALNFSAGISVEMSYSSDGSGSWTELVVPAFLNKYDYISAEWIEYGETNFFSIMINDMKAMRPVEISILDANWENGHAINVDGYNTDNYYHLNFGWGTSNNTCWYLLPSGMPDNYSYITGMAYNIEGGEVPVEVNGVVTSDINPSGTYILLESDHYIYEVYADSDGSFQIPAVKEGNYLVTATNNDRVHYYQQMVYIDEANDNLTINLFDFTGINGTVNAPSTIEEVYIALYREGECVYTTTTTSADYFIADVLPGNYQAVACMGTDYLDVVDAEISAQNMSINFELEQYEGKLDISYAAHNERIFHLDQQPVLTCAVKYDAPGLESQVGNAFTEIAFTAPFSSSEGTLKAQLWKNDIIVFEKDLADFNQGEKVRIDLDHFIVIEPDCDYYIGYRVLSTNGNYAYSDDYPGISGKSALIRATNSWITLQNYNFNISGTIISQTYATVTGNIVTDMNVEPSQIVVKAGMYVTTPDDDFSYTLPVYPGTYQIKASVLDGESVTETVTLADQELHNLNLTISLTDANDNEIPATAELSLSNYPNPFNLSGNNRSSQTTISFNLPVDAEVNIDIYNLKGQLIKTFTEGKLSAGNHQIPWNGNNYNSEPVSTGLYLLKLSAGAEVIYSKALLLK